MSISISLPPVSKTIHVDEIPTAHFLYKKPGLYVFYNVEKTPLYAGKSTNLRARLRSHATSSPFFPIAYQVDLYYVDNAAERDIYETYVISTLKPLYNREKVYANSTAKSMELYEVDTDIESAESELADIKQELKFMNWGDEKFHGIDDEYINLKEREKEVREELSKLKRKRSELIRKYFT